VREKILILENEVYYKNSSFAILSTHHYQTEFVRTSHQALERLNQQHFDLVLADLFLFESGALGMLRGSNDVGWNVPTVVMASPGSLQRAVLSVRLGVQGFVIKPFTSQELFIAVETALKKNRPMRERENSRLFEAMEMIHHDTVKALAQAIGVKDHYTGGHCDRMAEYALAVAGRFNLSALEKKVLAYAAALHDIGKIGIPETILNKTGKLTPEEYAIMKTHPEKGAMIVRGVDFLAPVIPLIYYHQECYDGRGYPAGLAGEEIPLGSRIVAVLDAFDAMTSDRPYRKALPIERAIAEIRRYSNQQFDPLVVDAFLEILKEQSLQTNPFHQGLHSDVPSHPLYRSVES
jgi:HD-GYP domain-containing protein (c-di-GMP phosphodiesterase class II)